MSTTLLQDISYTVRRPEEIAARCAGQPWSRGGGQRVLLFLVTAAIGLAIYGVTMRLHLGPEGMARGAVTAPLAAGVSWAIALPALYIVGGALGSTLTPWATLIAASITVCYGALAMLAGVPVVWFIGLALPYTPVRIVMHIIVFMGVGLTMADVFLRVTASLEPDRHQEFSYIWLALLGLIGLELFLLLDVFDL